MFTTNTPILISAIVVAGTATLGATGIIGECGSRLIKEEQLRKICVILARCLQAPSTGLILGFLSCAIGGALTGIPGGVAIGVGAFLLGSAVMIIVPIVAKTAENYYIRLIAKITDLGVSVITKLSTVLLGIILPHTSVLLGAISLVAISADIVDLFRGDSTLSYDSDF